MCDKVPSCSKRTKFFAILSSILSRLVSLSSIFHSLIFSELFLKIKSGELKRKKEILKFESEDWKKSQVSKCATQNVVSRFDTVYLLQKWQKYHFLIYFCKLQFCLKLSERSGKIFYCKDYFSRQLPELLVQKSSFWLASIKKQLFENALTKHPSKPETSSSCKCMIYCKTISAKWLRLLSCLRLVQKVIGTGFVKVCGFHALPDIWLCLKPVVIVGHSLSLFHTPKKSWKEAEW